MRVLERRRLRASIAFAIAAGVLIVPPLAQQAAAVGPGFITRIGTELVLDGEPFQFGGINIYNANSDGECWSLDARAADVSTTPSLRSVPARRSFDPGSSSRWRPLDGERDWTAFDHTLEVADAHGRR